LIQSTDFDLTCEVIPLWFCGGANALTRIFRSAKQLAVLALLVSVGCLAAQPIIDSGWGAVGGLLILSSSLTMLFTFIWHIPWLRRLGMPCWLVSFLPALVMYIDAVSHFMYLNASSYHSYSVKYYYSLKTLSNFFLGLAIVFVPSLLVWLVALSMMRRFQEEREREGKKRGHSSAEHPEASQDYHVQGDGS
jgi:hypothetical protein